MLDRRMKEDGWTRVAFGDVVRLSKARVADPEAAGIERVVGLEHIDPGELRIRRWSDVADGTTFTTLFKPGQVLFGKRRAYQRKVAVAEFEGVCSGDIYVLEPSTDRLMPELLPFLCQTEAFFDHAVGTSAGSLSPRTNWDSLSSFEFLLPPIQEQARWIPLLRVLEESREKMGKCNDAAYKLRSAHFQCEFNLLGRAGSGPLRALTELCVIRTGKLDSNAATQDGAYPYFTCDPTPKRIDDYAFDCEAVVLPGNNAQGIFWVKTYKGKFNAYQRTYIMEPDPDLMRVDYLACFLENQLSKLRNLSMGSTTKYLTMDLFSQLLVPVPTLNRQDDFLRVVAPLEQAVRQAEARQSQLKLLASKALGTLMSAGDLDV